MFYDVHGEPSGMHSFDMVWEFSEILYKCFLDLCYGLFSCLCGVWIVMYWGCAFAYTAFVHIWIFSPFLLIVKFIMNIFARPLKPIINCCIRPCCGACAHFFILFAEPGADIDKWNYPEIKTPVRRVQIEQEPKVLVKKQAKENPTPRELEEQLWLGEKERMARSVKRQMML